MKTHTECYQYIQSLQFSHNGMSIMVLKCVIQEGYIVYYEYVDLICDATKKCNFLHKLKGKSP
jgi:hypothetical protein